MLPNSQVIGYYEPIIINGVITEYLVSTHGEVVNKNSGIHLKPFIAGRGYLYVRLSVNKKKSSYLISRLVAAAFFENPHNYPMVNHKKGGDKGRVCNNVSNLEYCTCAQNNQHAYDTGLKSNYGANSHFNKYPEELICNICNDLVDGIDMRTLDKKWEVPFHLISDIYYKFKWKQTARHYEFPNNIVLHTNNSTMNKLRESIKYYISIGLSNIEIIDKLNLYNMKYCENTLMHYRK